MHQGHEFSLFFDSLHNYGGRQAFTRRIILKNMYEKVEKLYIKTGWERGLNGTLFRHRGKFTQKMVFKMKTN